MHTQLLSKLIWKETPLNLILQKGTGSTVFKDGRLKALPIGLTARKAVHCFNFFPGLQWRGWKDKVRQIPEQTRPNWIGLSV